MGSKKTLYDIAKSTDVKEDYTPVNKPKLNDYISLWLTKLAKLKRKHLISNQEKDIKNFYNDFFITKDIESWAMDQRRFWRRETINTVIKQHVNKGATILDVGCGFGEVLAGLADGFKLYGMDYSQSNVDAATKFLQGRAIIKQGSIYKIPYDTESQDVCICLEVLEHIEDDSMGVREIVRVLKPGGILIASVPYSYYWPQYKELIGHFRHYNRESFANLLTNNGLVIKDYLPNYPNWHFAYARRYSWVRFLSLTVGRLMKQHNLFEFKWPWSKKALMTKYTKNLEPLLLKDIQIDYANVDSSTFVVAKKPYIVEAR